MTIDELIDAARSGSTRAAGRLLSLVESTRRGEVLDSLGAVSAPRLTGMWEAKTFGIFVPEAEAKFSPNGKSLFDRNATTSQLRSHSQHFSYLPIILRVPSLASAKERKIMHRP